MTQLLKPGLRVERVSQAYEHALQVAYHRIDYRGLYVNPSKLAALKVYLEDSIKKNFSLLENTWGVQICAGEYGTKIKGALNLNSPKQVVKFLLDRKYEVPKSRKTQEESAEMLSLIRLYAKTNDPAIKALMDISKVKKVLQTYINCQLTEDSVYLCNYAVHATETGRRGSKKHLFGFGNNSQNWPKYTEFGKKFRGCIEARPGKIFFAVDQKQAEDWPVVALSENTTAFQDMLHGVDRHKKTASFLFAIPESQVRKYPERFLGKKFRHANNYKMGKQTASDSLAKDGFAMDAKTCQHLLDRMNQYDPSIRGVFHKYIEEQLSEHRFLKTPLGRERYFLGLRPRGDNSSIFGKAYAYIPQSSVGDNTGMAVLYLDSVDMPIVQECHDSIVLELEDNRDTILTALAYFREAFNRKLRFHNGWEVRIPLEAELGYNLKDTVSTETSKEKLGIPRHEDDMTEAAILKAYEMVRESREKELQANGATTQGAVVGQVS